MLAPRNFHSCGSIMVGDEMVLVVAGGDYFGGTSVEFLPLNQQKWKYGPSVPNFLDASIVSNNDNLYLVDTAFNAIYRLDCPTGVSSCHWSKMEQKLQDTRYSAVVSLIPDSLTSCT